MRDSDRTACARTQCLICGNQHLQPFLNLSEEGVPHDTAGHNFTYAYRIMLVCGECGHGQLEIHSHDCYSHYEDEDWEMFWWYALDPTTMNRLRDLLIACPDRLNVECDCALHCSLRDSGERLWGGIKHAVDPAGKIAFAWIQLSEFPDRLVLQIDSQKDAEQAV